MKTPKPQYRPEIAPKFDAFDSATERKLTGSAWFMAEPRDVAAQTVPAPVHLDANLAHFLEVMQVIFFVKSGLKLNDYAHFFAILRRVDKGRNNARLARQTIQRDANSCYRHVNGSFA